MTAAQKVLDLHKKCSLGRVRTSFLCKAGWVGLKLGSVLGAERGNCCSTFGADAAGVAGEVVVALGAERNVGLVAETAVAGDEPGGWEDCGKEGWDGNGEDALNLARGVATGTAAGVDCQAEAGFVPGADEAA